MVTTQQDFADEVAWELTILDLALPLTSLSGYNRKLDLRTNDISISFSESLSDYASGQLRTALLPLLFGAAWKVLDISIELALANAGCSPSNRKRWQIEEKASGIGSAGDLPALSPLADVWQALISLYRATKEQRHALVHRRVRVDGKTQELICFDTKGHALVAIDLTEQSAFCRVAQRVAAAAIDGRIHPRAESDLRTQLSRLQRHHSTNIVVPAAYCLPIKVVDDFPVDHTINVPTLKKRIRQTFPEVYYIDLELNLPDGRVLIGELEQAPEEVVSVHLERLPPWLKFN
jgi:hypothetical protein